MFVNHVFSGDSYMELLQSESRAGGIAEIDSEFGGTSALCSDFNFYTVIYLYRIGCCGKQMCR